MVPISVSIVTYCTPAATLARLLDSLAQDSAPKHVLIVDNSPEPTDYGLPPGNRYWFTGANLGYGRAHNRAVHTFDAARHPYHLIVNPDVSWQGDVLGPLIAHMETDPTTALVMPKVLSPTGEVQSLCKLLPTPADLLLRRFAPHAFGRAARERFELRFTGYARDMNVPFLSGCFMLLRRSAFDMVGGFDERYFLYAEDIDLSRRLHTRWRTMFLAARHIVHEHGRHSYRSARMTFVHALSVCKYFNKWGWFRDHDRRRINRETLSRLGAPAP